MLLRAGMSAKQAIIYNCLSSILCFVGMLIGVAVGKMEGSTLWVFSLVGGMFLYIALVDMVTYFLCFIKQMSFHLIIETT